MQYSPGSTVQFAYAFRVSDALVAATSPEAVILPPANATPIPVSLTEINGTIGVYGGSYTLPSDAAPGTWRFYYQGTVASNPFESSLETFCVLPSTIVTPGMWTSYCEPTWVLSRVVALNTAYTTEQLQFFCYRASALIDGTLRKRGYILPLSQPYDPLLIGIAVDLAAAIACQVQYQGEAAQTEPHLSKDLRAVAREDLRSLREDDLLLPYPKSPSMVMSRNHTSANLQRWDGYRDVGYYERLRAMSLELGFPVWLMDLP